MPNPITKFQPRNQDFTSAYLNEFYLTQPQIEKLSTHFILHWTGNYLSEMLDMTGCVEYKGIKYLLILPECSRIKFFQSPQVKLSFRSVKESSGYNFSPVVLVRFA